MQTVIFEVDLVSKFYNHWPYFKIYHNNKLIFNDEIIENKTLVYKLDCEKHNNLVFNHYGKQFGENNVWDKNPDTGEECLVTIKDIRLNSVSIGDLKRKLIFDVDWSDWMRNHDPSLTNSYKTFNSDGVMVFNGTITFDFETPVYDWLILNKYKVPKSNTAYFSNYTNRWHYEDDISVINEIKNLMNFDENSSC